MIAVIGHKVPDTDAITSAIVYGHYLNALGKEAQAFALGKANNETLFVLQQADVEMIPIISSLEEGTTIALVDHNESGQSIDKRDGLVIHSVIDHHKIDFSTAYPLMVRCEALASTNSILYKMYRDADIEIPKNIAYLMIGGILSDTLHFRSPTTTEEDIKILNELNTIANIPDITSFALEMFSAKSDLGDISPYALVKETDFKDFTFGSLKTGITCIETTNPSYCLNRKAEIIDTINSIKQQEGYDCLLVCIVDILNEKNITIVASSDEEAIVKKVFGTETVDGLSDLGNRISRKKTIVPPMEELLK